MSGDTDDLFAHVSSWIPKPLAGSAAYSPKPLAPLQAACEIGEPDVLETYDNLPESMEDPWEVQIIYGVEVEIPRYESLGDLEELTQDEWHEMFGKGPYFSGQVADHQIEQERKQYDLFKMHVICSLEAHTRMYQQMEDLVPPEQMDLHGRVLDGFNQLLSMVRGS